MTRSIRWAILGTGSIAHKFAQGLTILPGSSLVAVGSRSADTAARFADKFDIPRRHSSYDSLADDAEIDVVYIATPHPLHHDNCIVMVEHGKAVLCEKPLTVNAAEAA